MTVPKPRLLRISWVLALALLWAGSAGAADQIPPEAKLHFRNGVELIQGDSPNYQDAYYQFKLAYDKSQSWKVLGNLGLCALKLERDGEAREYYTKYLVGGGKSIDAEERGAIERELLFIEGNSARVTLTSSEANVQVVDARSGGAAPQSYTFNGAELALVLRAGNHTLTVTSASGKQLSWEAVLTPGSQVGHTFDFDAQPVQPEVTPQPVGPPPPPPPPPPPSSGGGSSALTTVGFVATGVGGAALIGGLITGLMANSKESEVKDLCPGTECPPGVSRAQVEGDLEDAQSMATVANVLLIGGGILAAGGIAMVVVGSSSGGGEQPQATLQLTPVLGAGSAGLFAHGRF